MNEVDPQQEELLTRLNYAVFGVRGDNGILGRVDSLDRKFDSYVATEEARRTDDLKREQNKDRMVALSAVSALVAAMGIVVTLVVVLVTVA